MIFKKYKNKIISLFFIFTNLVFNLSILAQDESEISDGVDAGSLAGNLFGVQMTVSQIIQKISIITGVALILVSLIQYLKHRKNPLETTLGTAVFTLFVGIALIVLAFIPISI